MRGGRGAGVFVKSSSSSEVNPDPQGCGCLLVLREMVRRARSYHLPMAVKVPRQADHKHADAERGSYGDADGHDQHSLDVSLGMGWEAQEGPHPGSHRPPLPGRPSPVSPRSLCSAAPGFPFLTIPSVPRGQGPQHYACLPTCSCSMAIP